MTGPQFDPDPHEADFPPEEPAVTEEPGEETEDVPDPDRVDPDVETEPGDDLEAEPVEERDPDLEAARETASSDRPDVLKTEELRPEEELEEPDPAPEPSLETRLGRTPAEAREGETLDERLEQERPEE
jgi:hypothetical protein